MSKTSEMEIKLRRTLIGIKLKKWRTDAKLSQQDVAKRLKYSSPQFISNWERGLSLPPMEVLPKLVALYQISVEEMTEAMFKYQEQYLEYQYTHLVKLLNRKGNQ